MDDFYIDNLVIEDLQNVINAYKEKFKTVLGLGSSDGILNIRTFTLSITKDNSWIGNLYNKVVTFWNDTTSVKLYNLLNDYNKNFIMAQNIVDVYKGLDISIGGTDTSITEEVSDDEYKILNEKLSLTDKNRIKYISANVNTFKNFVGGLAELDLPKYIEELNLYIEEKLKNKSTTLDKFVEIAENINTNFCQSVQTAIKEYYNVIVSCVETIELMEETNIKDVSV